MRKVLNELPVSLAEVKNVIDSRKKDSELTYEQKKTQSYVKGFCKLNEDKAIELINELIGIGLSRKLAVKIADVFPETKEEVKVLFSKDKSISSSDAEKIESIIQKYLE